MAISKQCRTLATFTLVCLAAAGCTRIDNALAAVPIFSFLRSAPSFDPYEHPLPSPAGSVPFESPAGEILPPLAASEPELRAFAATPAGQQPLNANDPQVLEAGKVMFERHCAVCHGTAGAGDGPLKGPGKFPLVPPVSSGNALTLPDGYVYAVIRAGRGLMPSYGARITHLERWAIVAYVKRLQAQTAAEPAPAAGPTAAPAAVDTSALSAR